jgi:hypothetical protein
MAGQANELKGAAAGIGKTAGDGISSGLARGLDGLANVIVGALQGGGDVVASIAAQLGAKAGGAIGGALGTALGGPAGKLIGEKLGAALGAIGGKAIAGLFQSKGRDAVKDFAESMGGFDALRQKMLVLEDGGEALWKTLTQGVGKNNPAQAAAAIKAIEDAFAKQGEASKKAADDAAAAAQKEIDVTNEVKDAIQSKIDNIQSQYDSVFESIREELESPEYDEMGNRIYGVVEQQGLDRMAELAKQRSEAEAELAIAGAKVIDQGQVIKDGIEAIFKDPIKVTFDVTGFPPGVTPPPGARFGGAFAEGGMAHVTRPTWLLAGEKSGGEDIMFSGVGKRFASNGDRPIVLQNTMTWDGRVVARSTVQYLGEEMALAGY